jgi:hypothetical protein
MYMESSFFIAGQNNEIPEPSKRLGLFWSLVSPLLGLPDASASVPLRFMGLGAARDADVNWQLDAVVRRDAKMRALNLPPTKAEVIGSVAADVVEAVKKVAKVTKTAAAVTWLASVLRDGPVPQKDIETLAKKEGIGTKPLKLAKGRLKVESVRKGRNHWAWRLPFAKAKEAKEG